MRIKEENKKIYTPSQALLKAEMYCAYQERSQQELRNKLYDWGLHSNDVEQIITEMITKSFLNEERFAIQLAGGKFRIKKWGKIKIKQALQLHKVSPYCIKKALAQIPDDDYIKTAQEVIEKKQRLIRGKITDLNKRKLAHFALSKGFESDIVWKILNHKA